MAEKKLKFELPNKIQEERRKRRKGAISKTGKDRKPPKEGSGKISADLLLKGLPSCESDVNITGKEIKGQENKSKPEIICAHPEYKEKGLYAQKHGIRACELLKDLCAL